MPQNHYDHPRLGQFVPIYLCSVPHCLDIQGLLPQIRLFHRKPDFVRLVLCALRGTLSLLPPAVLESRNRLSRHYDIRQSSERALLLLLGAALHAIYPSFDTHSLQQSSFRSPHFTMLQHSRTFRSRLHSSVHEVASDIHQAARRILFLTYSTLLYYLFVWGLGFGFTS